MFNPNDHMMTLKGKEYLQVMWRLVWFREDHPDWNIDTRMEEHVDDSAVFSCKISNAEGKQVSSGYGSESKRDFGDYLEKAETKAVGRALAMLGYGTQFAPELDEGERIVDSPVQRKAAPKPVQEAPRPVETVSVPSRNTLPPLREEVYCENCGKSIQPYVNEKTLKMVGVDAHVQASKVRFGKVICIDCINELKKEQGAE